MTSRMLLRTAVLLGLVAAQARAAPGDDAVRFFADLYAGTPVRTGDAVGAGVAVIRPGHDPILFTFGDADRATGTAFGPHTPFEIGSVTKVFTTNLLAQAVLGNTARLQDTLATFHPDVLAPLATGADAVTLGELATFTAGYPRYAPVCDPRGATPGCRPVPRPTVADYGGMKFANFFRTYPPRSQVPQGSAAGTTTPPFPYFYSNYSVGLLGLLLAADPSHPLDDGALDRWSTMLAERLLVPLGMTETSLAVPAHPGLGYQMPDLQPVLTGGAFARVVSLTAAGPYAKAPAVTVTGGGGEGAMLQAALDGTGDLASVAVVQAGTNYVPPPVVTFPKPRGVGGATAHGTAVIAGGRVTGVLFTGTGSGYLDPLVPVTFAGGFAANGRAAHGVAVTVGGSVAWVLISDGGAGYYDPLRVTIAPPAGVTNGVPIWAPAGALTSTLADMARFADAALGTAPTSPAVSPIMRAFQLAEVPRVCNVTSGGTAGGGAGGTSPGTLASCPSGAARTGLAWDIIPGSVPGAGPIVSKNGGVTGFSTQVFLLPSKGIAVVAFVNAFPQGEDGADVPTGFSADILAREMLNAVQLIYPD